jgi:hypothetical protein
MTSSDPRKPANAVHVTPAGRKPQRSTRNSSSRSAPEKPTKIPPAVTRLAILVLGMHRSGTSAVTRVISLLGASLPSELMPAVKDNNEAGFWESLDAYRLNDEILASAGSRWDDWLPFNPDWMRSPAKNGFKQRALALLKKDFGQSPLFVFKDPRLCRLLPFWLEVLDAFGAEPLIVLPLRNPLEVAASLQRRDGFSSAKGQAIWLRYVLDAERGSRGLKRSFVSFDALLDDWRTVADRLSQDLGMVWPRRSATAEMEIDAFLLRRLRHHVHETGSLAADPGLPLWVKDAYTALNNLQGVPEPDAARQRLDEVRSEFDQVCGTLGTLVRSEEMALRAVAADLAARLEQQTQRAQQLDALVAEMQDNALRREDRIRELEQAQVRGEALIAEMQDNALRREDRIRDLERARAHGEAQVAEMQDNALRREDRIRELEQARARTEALVAEMHDNALRREQRIEDLEGALAQAGTQVGELEQTAAERQAVIRDLRSVLAVERNLSRDASALKDQLLYRLNDRQTSAAGQLARPLYAAGRRLPRLVQGVAAVPKFAWWTLTLRLPERLRLRRLAAALLASGQFDLDWYLRQNPDVVLGGQNPVMHWLAQGWREGRAPNRHFDVRSFRETPSNFDATGLESLIERLQREAGQEQEPIGEHR